MHHTLFENQKDAIVLLARIALMLLFVIFGWDKLTDFAGTVTYMASTGVPTPTVATIIAIGMEFVIGIALVLGVYTRPLAMLFALYTLGTALIGHHFWTEMGDLRAQDMEGLFKNVSIVGGLLLLSVTGAGKYSVDKR